MDEAITYRTRSFLQELTEMKFSDREYNYSLIKLLGWLLLKGKDVVMYEWPELTFVKGNEVESCGYECARKYPKTARLLAAMNKTAYPRNPKAFPYYRVEIPARKSMPDWDPNAVWK